jgi:hypothetical protein
VVVFNTSKLTHVFGSKSVSFGVSLLQTNTNTSIQTSNVVIISKKKRGREEVLKTVNGETVSSQWLRAETVIPM